MSVYSKQNELKFNQKQLSCMTKIQFYIKKHQFMSLEAANFRALLFCTFSVFYAIFILKSAHLVTYKIACTMQYY